MYKLKKILILTFIIVIFIKIPVIALFIFNLFVVLAEEAPAENLKNDLVEGNDNDRSDWYDWLIISVLFILIIVIITQGPGPIDIDEILNNVRKEHAAASSDQIIDRIDENNSNSVYLNDYEKESQEIDRILGINSNNSSYLDDIENE